MQVEKHHVDAIRPFHTCVPKMYLYYAIVMPQIHNTAQSLAKLEGPEWSPARTDGRGRGPRGPSRRFLAGLVSQKEGGREIHNLYNEYGVLLEKLFYSVSLECTMI